MNIGNVGGSAAGYAHAQDVEDAVAGSSIEGQIACLVLDTQAHEKQCARDDRTAARQDLRNAIAEDIQALKEQADAQLRGAIFQGAVSVAGSGFSIAGALEDCNKPTWESLTGAGLDKLAKPLGDVVGNTHGAADAKAAQGAEEDAKSRIDDAKSAISSAEGAQGNALEFLRSAQRSDSAAAVAVLSNIA